MPTFTQEELRDIVEAESKASKREQATPELSHSDEVEEDIDPLSEQIVTDQTISKEHKPEEDDDLPLVDVANTDQDLRISAASRSESIEKDEPSIIEIDQDVPMHDAQEEIDQNDEDDSDEDAEAETADEGNEPGEQQDDSDASENDADENSSGEEEETIAVEVDSDKEQESAASSEEEERSSIEVNCAYCKEPEIPEQTEDTDKVLTCIKCGAQAHKRCASKNDAWTEDNTRDKWHCQDCADGQSSRSPGDSSNRKKNSAPRLVRDLLPVSRGLQKPNSHSIFAQPLISEGEEGGRSLRKRKSLTSEPPPSEKRMRKATPKALSIALAEEESVAHATRRASQKLVPTARVLQHRPPHKAPPHKFILAFRLDQNKIEKILNKPPRPGKRRDRRRQPKIPPPPVFQAPIPKFPALPTNHLIFPSMWGDRENEINAKPYGGILSEQEADTSRSLPQLRDREIFEIARKEAEEERRKTSAAAEAEINGEHANATKPNRTVSGPPSKIKCIQFGKHVIDTFYAAPYPEEYSHESRLFICEFCLKYLPSEFVAYRHKLKCPAKHPPGDEIYREGSISIWEVDGRKKTEYCQCLCLMAKMFLGSKTLYYDVEPFLFYILTEYDEFGYHFVGYFSKEKRPASQNNVSCILVMPIHQRKGYATFLIDFSYLLTRIEGKDGSPEKPLSDMGLTAYRSYWDLTIARQLLDIGTKPFSTKELMQRTGMTADDVIHSLERLYAFVRDPVTKTYAIRYDKQLYDNIILEYESKKHRNLKPENLVWTPYIMGRSDQAQLDGQPMQTVAPREGDDITTNGSQEPVIQLNSLKDLEDAVSPRTVRAQSHESSTQHKAVNDPQLVNGAGHIAPGPPTMEALTTTSSAGFNRPEAPKDELMNGLVNGDTEGLTGYALAYRTHKIPPNRFQIDPPIPSSMLRARLNKRKSNTRPRPNNPLDSSTPAPVRSSPRHAASVNGSVGDPTSPEKPSTPIRRSNRKSGLANMEVAVTDDSADEDDQEDEIESKPIIGDDDEEEAESQSQDGELEEEEEEAEESTVSDDEDEDELELPDGDDDDEEEEEEQEEEEDDDDDDDPEVEIEEDEDSSSDEDED